MEESSTVVRTDRRSRVADMIAGPVLCLYEHRHIVRRYTMKEIEEKYRNTFLGLFWFLLTPLLYLAAFYVVFGYLIPGREAAWEGLGGGELAFIAAIFSGLIVFWFFAQVAAQGANLIPKNSHLVSRVVFPTEALAWVVTFSSMFALAIHLLFFGLLYVVAFGEIPWMIVAMPVILVPFAMALTGLAWVLASVGAIIRDVGQAVQVGVTAMLFMSGVFFPAAQVPEGYRELFLLNPVARTIEDFRDLAFVGQFPSVTGLFVYLILAYVVMIVGYWTFKRLQPRFSESL